MYAIICDARSGRNLGVSHLALVDRSITRRMWWTTDNKNLLLKFGDVHEAETKAAQLSQNNARVVPFAKAVSIIEAQAARITASEKEIRQQEDLRSEMEDPDLSWDAHKG